MEISPRRSLSLDFDTSVNSPAASSYPPTYANCRTNMYTMQGMMKSSPEPKIQKSYKMTSLLSIDSATTSVLAPKKENFLTSMFGALTNIVVERFAKVPGSFMSNINNTLSVTVVPNEGIISQEFFKNLTRSCEQLASEQQNNDKKDDTRITEILPNKFFYDTKNQISHIFTDNPKKSPVSGKISLNSECKTIDKKNITENFIEIKSPDYHESLTETNNEFDVKMVPQETQGNNGAICHTNDVTMKNLQDEKISTNLGRVDKNDLKKKRTRVKKSGSSRSVEPKIEEYQEKMEISDKTCTTGLHTMWQRVVNGMTDRFVTPRNISPDSEVPMKKPNLAKPRRKTCTVARARGKGRGKSQLRRSGVSQSRHRKERTKQNIYSNIQDDLEAWQDSGHYDESENDELPENKQLIDEKTSLGGDSTNSSSNHCPMLFGSLSFNVSASPRKRKQKIRNLSSKCPMRVRYVPESSMEIENYDSSYIDEHDCTSRMEFRPRLVSESSVDSEDSYCIVFESGSESGYTDYDYDAVNDNEVDEEEKTTPRVRFNLEPQIHTMIQWDYAYRAARRGPWEEMARDRERFRGRIHCIERILSPILTSQHRKHVWQNRFDIDV